ncbi:MAG: hypothetical protein QOF60_692 [Actinomycetota bacterium]|nr:hypothetical protein [Actinomycetota bacterium]
MRIGVALPQYDYADNDWATVVAMAKRADRLGLDSAWLADHLFMAVEKYGAPPGHHFGHDPIVALAHLARATERIDLGVLVLCAQLRPANVLAHQLTTLRKLAGEHRNIVPGVGAGWHEPEYVEAGIPFERPGVRLRQMIEVLEVVGAAGFPKMIGGRGDRLMGLAAEHADGWNTAWAITPEEYEQKATKLPATVERSLGLYTLIGEDRRDLERRFRRLQELTPPGVVDHLTVDQWRTGRLVGTVEEVREQVADWENRGVSLIIAGLGALPFSISDPDDLDLLASALL